MAKNLEHLAKMRADRRESAEKSASVRGAMTRTGWRLPSIHRPYD
jgi:hypothetical protein